MVWHSNGGSSMTCQLYRANGAYTIWQPEMRSKLLQQQLAKSTSRHTCLCQWWWEGGTLLCGAGGGNEHLHTCRAHIGAYVID